MARSHPRSHRREPNHRARRLRVRPLRAARRIGQGYEALRQRAAAHSERTQRGTRCVRINGETQPPGWCRATVGETCEILAGYGFPESLQGRTEGDVPFYKVGDISEAWKQGSVHL